MKVLKFLDENLEKMLCVIFLALMSIIIVLQVFFRYVLNNSLSWSEELARYLFIWMIYVGISYGVKLDKHICVDAVYTFMPKSIKRGYAIVAYVLFLIFAVAIIYYGILVVGMQISSGQVSPAMGLPMQYVYAAPVVGMVLTVVRLVQKIYYAVTARNGNLERGEIRSYGSCYSVWKLRASADSPCAYRHLSGYVQPGCDSDQRSCSAHLLGAGSGDRR